MHTVATVCTHPDTEPAFRCRADAGIHCFAQFVIYSAMSEVLPVVLTVAAALIERSFGELTGLSHGQDKPCSFLFCGAQPKPELIIPQPSVLSE